MNTTSKASSAQLNRIKLDSLDLIRDIRDAQTGLTIIKNTAGELGLRTARKENESELEYLGSLAEEACEAESKAQLEEARAHVQATVRGENLRTSGPRSFVGRLLGKAAAMVG